MGNLCAGLLPQDDQMINIDFDYNVDNKDNSDANKDRPIGYGNYGDNAGGEDRYDHEENMFYKADVYKPDVELDFGFPDDRQEYDSFPCLEDVMEEYQSVPRRRKLNANVPQRLQSIMRGAKDFFRAETVGL